MVLKLDPGLPVVWRSPTSLQIGVAEPAVTLLTVSDATERIIAGLRVGLTPAGLGVIRNQVGVSEREVESLLETLAPAMASVVTPVKPATILLVGSGQTAARIAGLLAESGLSHGLSVRTAADSATAAHGECDFAIAVGHFALDPDLHGLWLRRDIPHLPVVLSDTEVVIGPTVEPGTGPCLYCLHRHSTDADPAWPAIATQLYGKRSPADSALIASEVAAIVCRLTLARVAAGVGSASVHSSTHLDVRTGEVSAREVTLHPQCGCTVPGWTNAEAQQEIERAVELRPARRRHSRQWPPRKVSGASSRA